MSNMRVIFNFYRIFSSDFGFNECFSFVGVFFTTRTVDDDVDVIMEHNNLPFCYLLKKLLIPEISLMYI